MPETKTPKKAPRKISRKEFTSRLERLCEGAGVEIRPQLVFDKKYQGIIAPFVADKKIVARVIVEAVSPKEKEKG